MKNKFIFISVILISFIMFIFSYIFIKYNFALIQPDKTQLINWNIIESYDRNHYIVLERELLHLILLCVFHIVIVSFSFFTKKANKFIFFILFLFGIYVLIFVDFFQLDLIYKIWHYRWIYFVIYILLILSVVFYKKNKNDS